MKKLLSTSYSNAAFNIAILLLRVTLGMLMIPHGYDKLVHFADRRHQFINFLGIGNSFSLALVVFAEFFCSIFLVLGLFTRFAAFPLTISLSVALFKIHHGDLFGDGEHAALFLGGMFTIMLLGPGKISADGAMGN